jgi:uncharacterized protein (DUF983 family)
METMTIDLNLLVWLYGPACLVSFLLGVAGALIVFGLRPFHGDEPRVDVTEATLTEYGPDGEVLGRKKIPGNPEPWDGKISAVCPKCGTQGQMYYNVASDTNDCHECGARYYLNQKGFMAGEVTQTNKMVCDRCLKLKKWSKVNLLWECTTEECEVHGTKETR